MSGGGIYVRRESVERQCVRDLLIEAAYLLDQPDPELEAWGMVAVLLALHRLARSDDDHRILARATTIIESRKRGPS